MHNMMPSAPPPTEGVGYRDSFVFEHDHPRGSVLSAGIFKRAPPRLSALLRCAVHISPAVHQVVQITVSLENFRDAVNAISFSHSPEIKDDRPADRKRPSAYLPFWQHKLRHIGARHHGMRDVIPRLLQ